MTQISCPQKAAQLSEIFSEIVLLSHIFILFFRLKLNEAIIKEANT